MEGGPAYLESGVVTGSELCVCYREGDLTHEGDIFFVWLGFFLYFLSLSLFSLSKQVCALYVGFRVALFFRPGEVNLIYYTIHQHELHQD